MGTTPRLTAINDDDEASRTIDPPNSVFYKGRSKLQRDPNEYVLLIYSLDLFRGTTRQHKVHFRAFAVDMYVQGQK